MNLCIVTRTTVYHSRGGMQEELHTLATGLAALGHCVVVITTRHPDGPCELEIGGVEYHFLETTIPELYEHGFPEQAYTKFQQLHRMVGFDLLHSQSFAATKFCGCVPMPLTCRIHGVLAGWRSSESLYATPVWKVLTWGQRASALRNLPKAFIQGVRDRRLSDQLYRASDAIILGSEFTRRLLLETSPWIDRDKVRLVPLGIDTSQFVPIDKEVAKARLGLEGPVLLFLSRLTLHKGPKVVLRAFEGLDIPGTHLIFGGIGPELHSLQRYVAARDIKKVHFSSISHADRALYYSAADLFIYPEISDPAFGLVGAEAMACGTPVVGSDAGAIPEVVGDCGFIFPRGDVSALRERIREALNGSPTRLHELGKRGRARVESRFSQARMVSAMSELFEGVLARPTR